MQSWCPQDVPSLPSQYQESSLPCFWGEACLWGGEAHCVASFYCLCFTIATCRVLSKPDWPSPFLTTPVWGEAGLLLLGRWLNEALGDLCGGRYRLEANRLDWRRVPPSIRGHATSSVLGNLNSLSPSFLIYKVGKTKAATKPSCNNNKGIKLWSPKCKAWPILLLLINYSPPHPFIWVKLQRKPGSRENILCYGKRGIKMKFSL